MSTYAPNDEGIEALTKMSVGISESAEEIVRDAASLRVTAESNKDVLGPSTDELEEALEAIKTAVAGASSPIEEISEKLKDLADDYQDIVDQGLGVSGN